MPVMTLLFSLALGAAPVTNLTLNDCFLNAVQRSYAVADQGEVLKQAEEQYLQSWQNFMPSLSLSGGELVTGLPVSNVNAFNLSLSQPLFRGFKSIAILEQSKHLIRAQKEAWEWAYFQLYLETAQAFYNLISARKQLEHVQNQVRLLDEQTKEIEDRVRIGRSRASDLSSVLAARALAYSQQVQMEGQLSNAFELFQFVTGMSNITALVPDTDLPGLLPELGQFLASLDDRPDLKAAKYQSLSVLKAIDIAKSGQLPWADLVVSAVSPQVWDGSRWSWSIQLTVTYGLFADAFVQSKVREAESEIRQSDLAYRYLSDGIRRDTSLSYYALLSGIERIKSYREALKYLKDNYRQMEQDYRQGIVKMTDVLSAYSSYEDAVRALDALLLAAQMEWLRLRVYSGKFRLPAEAQR